MLNAPAANITRVPAVTVVRRKQSVFINANLSRPSIYTHSLLHGDNILLAPAVRSGTVSIYKYSILHSETFYSRLQLAYAAGLSVCINTVFCGCIYFQPGNVLCKRRRLRRALIRPSLAAVLCRRRCRAQCIFLASSLSH